MRMRVMVATLTVIALWAAACGEPGTAGESAETATTTAAPEATTTTEPGPPKYNVSLDVAYLEDYSSVYHVGFPPELPDTTYGFEVNYHLNTTIEEAEFVEPDAAGTLDWWIYDYDYVAIELVDSWTGSEPADFDVPTNSSIFGRDDRADALADSQWGLGPAVQLLEQDDELWLVHRLPAAVEMADPPENTPWDHWSAWGLVWGPARSEEISHNVELEPGHPLWLWSGVFLSEGDGRPDYWYGTPEQAGWIIWSIPLADIGIEAHDIDFEMIEDDVQHVYKMHVTGTISRASN